MAKRKFVSSVIYADDLVAEANKALFEIAKGNIPPHELNMGYIVSIARNKMVDHMRAFLSPTLTPNSVRNYIRELAEFEKLAKNAASYQENANIARLQGTTMLRLELMRAAIYGSTSIHAPLSPNYDDWTLADILPAAETSNPSEDLSAAQDHVYIRMLLYNSGLTEREYFIVYHHILSADNSGNALKEKDIAKLFGVTESRVCQLETIAKKKMFALGKELNENSVLFKVLYHQEINRLHETGFDFQEPANYSTATKKTLLQKQAPLLYGREITQYGPSQFYLMRGHIRQAAQTDNLPIFVTYARDKEIIGVIVSPHVAEFLQDYLDFSPEKISYKNFLHHFSKYSNQGRKSLCFYSKKESLYGVYIPLRVVSIPDLLTTIEDNIPNKHSNPLLAERNSLEQPSLDNSL